MNEAKWYDRIDLQPIIWGLMSLLLIVIGYFIDENHPVSADLCKMAGAAFLTRIRSGKEK